MVSLTSTTKIKFNCKMHGIAKDQIIDYTRASNQLKTLIRRRIKDNDGSVEVINVKIENKLKPETKPVEVKAESKNKNKKGDK
jgi:hypothetical protein